MVPPTSMCTGAVYLEAAATHGIPVILWLQLIGGWEGGVGVGDDELDIVGDVAGELLSTEQRTFKFCDETANAPSCESNACTLLEQEQILIK